MTVISIHSASTGAYILDVPDGLTWREACILAGLRSGLESFRVQDASGVILADCAIVGRYNWQCDRAESVSSLIDMVAVRLDESDLECPDTLAAAMDLCEAAETACGAYSGDAVDREWQTVEDFVDCL